jgi:hypothetical protein
LIVGLKALCIDIDPGYEYAEDNCDQSRQIEVDEGLAEGQIVDIIAEYDTSLVLALGEKILEDSDESPASSCCEYTNS